MFAHSKRAQVYTRTKMKDNIKIVPFELKAHVT